MCCTFDCSFTEANLYQSSRYSWQKITTCPVRASSCVLRCGLFQHHFFRTEKAQPKMLSSEESASTGNAFLSMVGNGLSVELMCGFHFHGNFMLHWKISEPWWLDWEGHDAYLRFGVTQSTNHAYGSSQWLGHSSAISHSSPTSSGLHLMWMATISHPQLVPCNLRFLFVPGLSGWRILMLIRNGHRRMSGYLTLSRAHAAQPEIPKSSSLVFGFLNRWDYEHRNKPLYTSICQIANPWNMKMNSAYLKWNTIPYIISIMTSTKLLTFGGKDISIFTLVCYFFTLVIFILFK